MGIGMVQSGYGVFLNKQTTEVERKRKNAYGTERSRDEKDKTAECMEFLRGKSEEILEKLRNGETEVSYPIGAEFYTEKEWDKLLKKFDDIQEDVRQKMEERFRKPVYFALRMIRDEEAKEAYRRALEAEDVNGVYMRDLIKGGVKLDEGI